MRPTAVHDRRQWQRLHRRGDLLNPISAGGWEDGINGKSNANDKYTDDIVGWDFAENDNDPFDDGTANEGHGTHTAGIIGAVGNNGTGISGVDPEGQRDDRAHLQGQRRLGQRLDHRRRHPLLGRQRRQGLQQQLGRRQRVQRRRDLQGDQYAGTKGQLFVVAAGNDGGNLDSARFNDFPTEYNLDNIISVAATNSAGNMPYWSNYGTSTVDVAAPGSNILSTLPATATAR
jgi:hypothetical protein